MSYPYPELREEARDTLERIFRTGEVMGVDVSAMRGHRADWAPPLNPEYFGVPDGNAKYVVAPATVSIRGWLRLQASIGGDRGAFDFSSWRAGAYPATVEMARENTRSIPTPILEVKRDGSVSRQEGRSRAIGAQEAGLVTMPAWIAVQVYR